MSSTLPPPPPLVPFVSAKAISAERPLPSDEGAEGIGMSVRWLVFLMAGIVG